MRRASIVKEYSDIPVSGVKSMRDKTNFLCSKMMDIEDTLFIKSRAITDTYNDIKFESIELSLDDKQSTADRTGLTIWNFTFDSIKLLREYLYNEIYTENPDSPFKLLDEAWTQYNSKSKACFQYIDNHLLDRYKVSEFRLYCTYYELNLGSVPGTGTGPTNPIIYLLNMTPEYSYTVVPSDLTLTEKISFKPYSDGIIDITYKQTKPSKDYTFVWYYDVIFQKI